MNIETKYFSIDDLYNVDNKSTFWKFMEREVKVALSKSSMSLDKKEDALDLFKKQYIKKFFMLHKPKNPRNYKNTNWDFDLGDIDTTNYGTWKQPEDDYNFDLENAQYIIEKFIWMQIHPDDRSELFGNDINRFDDWVITLTESQIDDIVSKLQRGERLAEPDYEGIKDTLYEMTDGSIRVFKIDGLMVMSSLNKDGLDIACKKIFRKKGITFKYRTTKNYEGKTVHSYIFQIGGHTDTEDDNMT
tara:strand:- start:162 stop:896 length:735 start_codon:yes stop_codon:yes gene_type:complete